MTIVVTGALRVNVNRLMNLESLDSTTYPECQERKKERKEKEIKNLPLLSSIFSDYDCFPHTSKIQNTCGPFGYLMMSVYLSFINDMTMFDYYIIMPEKSWQNGKQSRC